MFAPSRVYAVSMVLTLGGGRWISVTESINKLPPRPNATEFLGEKGSVEQRENPCNPEHPVFKILGM